MFKKSLCLIFLAFTSFSAPSDNLPELEKEIESVSKELKEQELKAMHLEVDSQAQMLEEWHEYAEEVEEIEKLDKRIQSLREKLNGLNEKKASLLKRATPDS